MTVLVKHRSLSIKASSAEARYLSALIDELENRGIAIEPGNETLESVLTDFANAVATRGGARWQMFFLLKTPADAVNEYLR